MAVAKARRARRKETEGLGLRKKVTSDALSSRDPVIEYRTLLTLRYAAESIEEVNVFLARTLEIQLRLRQRGALDRAIVFLGGFASTLVAAFTIGEEYFAPAIVVAAFLFVVFIRACLNIAEICRQRKELTTDHTSVRDYLRKATRDRKENRISVAIQNRKTAARILETSDLPDDERAFLERAVIYWGRRLKSDKEELRSQKNSKTWHGQEEMWDELMSWVDSEFDARPP